MKRAEEGQGVTTTLSGNGSLKYTSSGNAFVDDFASLSKYLEPVLWDVPNNYYGESRPKFESLAEEGNFFYMSGFDGSGIAFLTGTKYQERLPRTAEELFEDAMNQELLNKLSL